MTTSNPITNLKGLNWGHRRAIGPMIDASSRFSRITGGPTVDWAVRDLRDFEHQPISEAARLCDLLIFDHPFTGEIAESGVFLAVDDIVDASEGANHPENYIGPSLDSYRWGGKTWGAPVDGATMNAIYRDDVLKQLGHPLPRKWEEVMTLARAARKSGLWMGMANGDHHGFLAAGSLMHNMGSPWSASPESTLNFDMNAFELVLDALAELASCSHPDCGTFNSVALHDAMVSRDDIVYCPSVFGYATYGESDHGTRRLSFGPAPGMAAPYEAGTLVGGTAIAISSSCANTELAKEYLAFLLKNATQRRFTQHHGQPALIEAWNDPEVDRAFNGYFSATRTTIETAATRPRFNGFGRFERQAGFAVGAFLRGNTSRAETLGVIRGLADRWTSVAA